MVVGWGVPGTSVAGASGVDGGTVVVDCGVLGTSAAGRRGVDGGTVVVLCGVPGTSAAGGREFEGAVVLCTCGAGLSLLTQLRPPVKHDSRKMTTIRMMMPAITSSFMRMLFHLSVAHRNRTTEFVRRMPGG